MHKVDEISGRRFSVTQVQVIQSSGLATAPHLFGHAVSSYPAGENVSDTFRSKGKSSPGPSCWLLWTFYQYCGSKSERIRAFFAESEPEIFVPDLDSDSDPVPNPVM